MCTYREACFDSELGLSIRVKNRSEAPETNQQHGSVAAELKLHAAVCLSLLKSSVSESWSGVTPRTVWEPARNHTRRDGCQQVLVGFETGSTQS